MIFFLTESINKNFKKWFGTSKVGTVSEPKVCYHGSKVKGIASFDIKQIGKGSGNLGHYGYGFYFSEDKREALSYGDNIYDCYLKIEKPFKASKDQLIELLDSDLDVGTIIEINIKKDSLLKTLKQNNKLGYEFVTTAFNKGLQTAWQSILKLNLNDQQKDFLNDLTDVLEYVDKGHGVPYYIKSFLEEYNLKVEFNKDFETEPSLHWITDLGNQSEYFTNVVIKKGYDGVIYGSEYVVFSPLQIKSINNDGTYDIDDKNIYS